MNHNKHYDYFRRLIFKELGDEHELHFLVADNATDEIKKSSNRLKRRYEIEKKLLKISIKNDEMFIYFKNRLKSVFFGKYKKLYDKYKLDHIDNTFLSLSEDLESPINNIFHIGNINNNRVLIDSINPDLIIVVGAPFIQSHIVDINCLKVNLHIGFLPNYRGIKTIEWAIINNEFDKIGFTIHELTHELDKGKIISRRTIDIDSLDYDLAEIYVLLYKMSFNELIKVIKIKGLDAEIKIPTKQYKVYNNYKFDPVNYRKLIKARTRLAIFAGNPVQYHAPIYKALAAENDVDLTVLYGSDIGAKKFYSKEFRSFIEWDIPLFEGYKYIFFKNFSLRIIKGTFSRINVGMFFHIIVNQYDVVVIHGYDTVSSWLVFMAAKLKGVKIIWRGEASIRPSNRQNFFKKFIKQRLLPSYFSSCDAVIYSCTGNQEYINQFNVDPSKMFLMPCAVDNQFFRDSRLSLKERADFRRTLNISDEDFVILFASRFISRKRPLDLINAVSNINNKNIFLLFVGDGPLKLEMQSLVKKFGLKSFFTGFIGQKQVSSYYSIADMYAILSDYDASPKSLNEALNFELPILVTDKVGTAYDLVKDGQNGFIVRSRDIKEMSQKIDHLNNNRLRTISMGKNSLPISNDWTIENDIKGLKKAIKKCGRLRNIPR